MKIIYFTREEIPSNKTHTVQIVKMCEAFGKAENDVLLVSFAGEKSVLNLYNFYGVRKCFKHKQVIVPKIKKLRSFFVLMEILKIKKQENPDIVYTRNHKNSFLSVFFRIPTVFELHEPCLGLFEKITHKFVLKNNYCKKVIFISEPLKNYYANKYPNFEEKMMVAENGATPISKNVFPIRSKNNYILNIGYIGQLYKGKGMELILKLVPQMPFNKFHIIGGDGKSIPYWQKKVEKYKNIRFYGYLPHKKIERFLVSFDILIAPYQKIVLGSPKTIDVKKWMSPLKIFEYMSSGRPMICSDLPELKYFLENEKNCLLCDPNNLSQWFNAIKRLENDDLSKKLAQKAKRDFLRNHTFEKRAKDITKEISTLLVSNKY